MENVSTVSFNKFNFYIWRLDRIVAKIAQKHTYGTPRLFFVSSLECIKVYSVRPLHLHYTATYVCRRKKNGKNDFPNACKLNHSEEIKNTFETKLRWIYVVKRFLHKLFDVRCRLWQARASVLCARQTPLVHYDVGLLQHWLHTWISKSKQTNIKSERSTFRIHYRFHSWNLMRSQRISIQKYEHRTRGKQTFAWIGYDAGGMCSW